jgi:ubiquinone biosynthesis protein
MQVLKISRRYKNITRLVRIVSIIGKYGFSAFLKQISAGLGALPAKILSVRQEKSLINLTQPERVRLAVEELGPAFIKMGQLLSLRPDIIPPEYAGELEKLQDRTPPVPFAAVRQTVEDEFGQALGEVFELFEEIPVASGSIAQVHKARLKGGGDTVAVKVLKPGTREIVETDLAIITMFVRLASHYIPEFHAYNPAQMMHEFSEVLLNQLNFLREARTMERFRKFFAGDGFIHIPNVHPDYTTNSVITMEFIDGIKVSDVEAIEKAGLDRKAIAENGTRIVLKEIFEYGFFHADPHPGNLFVLPGNVVAPVDFGITGYVDDEGIQVIGAMLLGLLDRDVDRIIRVLKRYDFIRDDVDSRRLKIDLYDLIDMTKDVPLEKIDFTSSFQAIFQLTRKHEIRFPSEYFIIFNTLFEMDGVGRGLFPEFNVTKFAEPYARRWLLRQYSPGRFRKEARSLLDDLNYFIKLLPGEIGSILKRIRFGKLRLPLFIENLDRAVNELDRIGNRLSFSIIIAALLLSSSIIVQAKIGPFVKDYPVLGLLGYFIAAVMGIWLLVGIIKSGRL